MHHRSKTSSAADIKATDADDDDEEEEEEEEDDMAKPTKKIKVSDNFTHLTLSLYTL